MLDERIVGTDYVVGAHSAGQCIHDLVSGAQPGKLARISVGKNRPGDQHQDENDDCYTVRFFSYRHNYILNEEISLADGPSIEPDLSREDD